MNRVRLAKRIHEIAKDKGWWEKKRNTDEIFMLIITELAEAIEADRAENWVSIGNFNAYKDSVQDPSDFEKYIKDTVEDEIADAYIRCLDYLYYRKREFFNHTIPNSPKEYGDNFAENIFHVCKQITDRQTANAIADIESLCDHEEIDLEWHIVEKMKYNAQREYKHGGKKY